MSILLVLHVIYEFKDESWVIYIIEREIKLKDSERYKLIGIFHNYVLVVQLHF